jgi:hypothetical protein
LWDFDRENAIEAWIERVVLAGFAAMSDCVVVSEVIFDVVSAS